MNNSMIKTVGILGAGKLGIVLAQLALQAGYNVLIAGSGDPNKIRLTVSVLAPGAEAVTKEEVAQKSDVVIAALPLSKYKNLPIESLVGNILIDAMNFWWEVDGDRDALVPPGTSSSEYLQALLKNTTVIKALSHTGYHELHDSPRPKGDPDRKAIAVAADDSNAIKLVCDFIDTLGFDPLPIGSLAKGKLLEPGQPGFGTNLSKASLAARLSAAR